MFPGPIFLGCLPSYFSQFVIIREQINSYTTGSQKKSRRAVFSIQTIFICVCVSITAQRMKNFRLFGNPILVHQILVGAHKSFQEIHTVWKKKFWVHQFRNMCITFIHLVDHFKIISRYISS